MKLSIALPVCLIAVALLPGFRPGAQIETTKPVTVFLVRHAETESSTRENRDPALSEEGAERAGELRRLLGKAGVSHLFTSEFIRTKSTLAPLAKALELDVTEVAAQKMDAQVKLLRELPEGSVAVVAGHSNTIPRMARALGGELHELEDSAYGPALAHESYDRLFVVTLSAGEGVGTQTIELRYGE